MVRRTLPDYALIKQLSWNNPFDILPDGQIISKNNGKDVLGRLYGRELTINYLSSENKQPQNMRNLINELEKLSVAYEIRYVNQ